jgi:hypothetical protein
MNLDAALADLPSPVTLVSYTEDACVAAVLTKA